jgi:hypothetical protein
MSDSIIVQKTNSGIRIEIKENDWLNGKRGSNTIRGKGKSQ